MSLMSALDDIGEKVAGKVTTKGFKFGNTIGGAAEGAIIGGAGGAAVGGLKNALDGDDSTSVMGGIVGGAMTGGAIGAIGGGAMGGLRGSSRIIDETVTLAKAGGSTVAEKASSVGSTVAEKAGEAKDYVQGLANKISKTSVNEASGLDPLSRLSTGVHVPQSPFITL